MHHGGGDLWVGWQAHDEGCRARVGLDGDLALVPTHDFGGDVEAKTQAAGAAGMAGAPEWGKDARNLFAVERRALGAIDDAQLGDVVLEARLDRDRRRLGPVLDRVADEICDDLAEAPGVPIAAYVGETELE